MPQTLTIPLAIAEVGFTIEVPDGFLHVETPREDVDFDNPTQSAPLALFSSQVALALMAVAGRPAYATGSVLQWTKYLCDFFGIEIESFESGKTAGAHAHPAIIALSEKERRRCWRRESTRKRNLRYSVWTRRSMGRLRWRGCTRRGLRRL